MIKTQSVPALLLGASLAVTAPALSHAKSQAEGAESPGNRSFAQFKERRAADAEWTYEGVSTLKLDRDIKH